MVKLHDAPAVPLPYLGGPGSRSTSTTSLPRRASAMAVNRPVGPPPTMIVRTHPPFKVTYSVVNTPRVTSMSEHVKRDYRSGLRTAQAEQTRRSIVSAAARLFVDDGYGATTIDAVAESAGVSRKTVFTAVGGKVDLLKTALDWAVAGDDQPVAVADRPEVRELLAMDDPVALLTSWARVMVAIDVRVAGLFRVLEIAADGDAAAQPPARRIPTAASRRRARRGQAAGRAAGAHRGHVTRRGGRRGMAGNRSRAVRPLGADPRLVGRQVRGLAGADPDGSIAHAPRPTALEMTRQSALERFWSS